MERNDYNMFDLNTEYKAENISESELLLVNMTNGKMFLLNQSSSEFYKMCSKSHSHDELIQLYIGTYRSQNIAERDLKEDADKLFSWFLSNGFIQSTGQ